MGAAGYAVYLNYTKRQAMAKELAAAQTTLAERQRAFKLLQEQQLKLMQEDEETRRKQEASETQVTQLSQERERLNSQVALLAQEQRKGATSLKDAMDQVNWLHADVASMEQEHKRLQEEKHALETAVMRRDRQSLTTAEIEQISQTLAALDAERTRLAQHVEELSHAYEQLADDRRKLAEGMDTHPPEPGSTWASQLAVWATGLGKHEDVLAIRYKEVGQGYLAIHDYGRAADAFEKSLELHDDPALHTELALLYSRFLHNADLAGQHAAASPTIPSMRPGDSARAQRMPRSSWQLLRDWLTQ